jgi:hypothetical protein
MPQGAGPPLPSVQECLKADEPNVAALPYSLKDEPQTALFKDPVRIAQ